MMKQLYSFIVFSFFIASSVSAETRSFSFKNLCLSAAQKTPVVSSYLNYLKKNKLKAQRVENSQKISQYLLQLDQTLPPTTLESLRANKRQVLNELETLQEQYLKDVETLIAALKTLEKNQKTEKLYRVIIALKVLREVNIPEKLKYEFFSDLESTQPLDTYQELRFFHQYALLLSTHLVSDLLFALSTNYSQNQSNFPTVEDGIKLLKASNIPQKQYTSIVNLFVKARSTNPGFAIDSGVLQIDLLRDIKGISHLPFYQGLDTRQGLEKFLYGQLLNPGDFFETTLKQGNDYQYYWRELKHQVNIGLFSQIRPVFLSERVSFRKMALYFIRNEMPIRIGRTPGNAHFEVMGQVEDLKHDLNHLIETSAAEQRTIKRLVSEGLTQKEAEDYLRIQKEEAIIYIDSLANIDRLNSQESKTIYFFLYHYTHHEQPYSLYPEYSNWKKNNFWEKSNTFSGLASSAREHYWKNQVPIPVEYTKEEIVAPFFKGLFEHLKQFAHPKL